MAAWRRRRWASCSRGWFRFYVSHEPGHHDQAISPAVGRRDRLVQLPHRHRTLELRISRQLDRRHATITWPAIPARLPRQGRL